jgi:hypothetical protein
VLIFCILCPFRCVGCQHWSCVVPVTYASQPQACTAFVPYAVFACHDTHAVCMPYAVFACHDTHAVCMSKSQPQPFVRTRCSRCPRRCVPHCAFARICLLLIRELPSVKYVYAVDYKSMIGGYRTLLVMNSLLIPLRYLIHA